ncbi:MAG: ATP-binding protein [Bacteroidetes bacterium]|nr:ATP-binding protein [Bacteroidota bacterium]
MKEKEIIITNELSELSRITSELEILGEVWDWSAKIIFNINLVIEELITNIIFYAYRDKDKHKITIGFNLDNNILRIRIEDDGVEFNPLLSNKPDDLNKSIEERKIGGLGIHFVRKLVDNVEYQRYEKKNVLTLIKKI